jgi:hypothetical protein
MRTLEDAGTDCQAVLFARRSPVVPPPATARKKNLMKRVGCDVLRFQRLAPAIECAPTEGTVLIRLQLEGFGFDADLLEPSLEALEAGFRQINRRLMLCQRMDCQETLCRIAFLIEPVGELIFVRAPF